ncbi:hypothetical protein CIB48_g6975 [Xylaria polymorpha]|nr:hypothetical protein CIB48_g6975 [Xylaria polymorpha]
MTTAPFTPYWRVLGAPAGPNSWVFFVVALIAGRHRPVAVVSSPGTTEPAESLQGYPLTACCQRIVRIFADPANHTAVRGELALAADYYARDGGCEYRPEPVELPPYNRMQMFTPRPWDRITVPEFPFISACLLQGVAFNPQVGRTAPTRPEPLATVYRDTSVEWGMVVVDITNLNAVCYGIVGFSVSMAVFVPSLEAEISQFNKSHFARERGVLERGDLRVMEEVRPRKAMSAAEYMAKFGYEASVYGNAGELLARVPLVDVTAMSVVWPQGSGVVVDLPAASQPVEPEITSQDCMITRVIQKTLDLNLPVTPEFTKASVLPKFQDLLQKSLIQHSDRLNNICSAGHLIRLAFADRKHLCLERIKNLSAETISTALDYPGSEEFTSVSLCINSAQSAPAQLAEVLSRATSLKEIYFLQSPAQESDEISVQLFEELAARPQILSRARVMFASAYSAALRKRRWLPAILNGDSVQLAPLEVFPVQQIFVRHRISPLRVPTFHYDYVHLGDALLQAEHFAANFLLYLTTLEPGPNGSFDSIAQLFSLSSGPGSLAADPLSATKVSPIPAETFARSFWPSDPFDQNLPLVRDLVPGGWTVIVENEGDWKPGSDHWPKAYYIRYAFIRPRKQRIATDCPLLEAPGPQDLEVAELKEFLDITAPEVDPTVIEHRLNETAKKLSQKPHYEPLRPGLEPLSVLTQPDAANLLADFPKNARRSK